MNEYHELTAPAGTVAELIEILSTFDPDALVVNYNDRALVGVEEISAGWVEIDRIRLRFGRRQSR